MTLAHPPVGRTPAEGMGMRVIATILAACTVAVLAAAPAGAATARGAASTPHVTGGGSFVRIPGWRKERIDSRVLGDVAHLVRKYHLRVNAGYAMTGHSSGGEHPIGLALDVGPSRGPKGSWEAVDRLARWAEPRQGRPRAPFTWVGYNGDAGHGRGAHLHLSWSHTATRPGSVARTVWVLKSSATWALDPIAPVAPSVRP